MISELAVKLPDDSSATSDDDFFFFVGNDMNQSCAIAEIPEDTLILSGMSVFFYFYMFGGPKEVQ